MYTFSGQSPQNPTLDPILYAELPWFSDFEMTKMIGYGMPGVWTHAFVDMWSPGYLGFMSSNHNGMLRMYETMGNGGANTMRRTIGGGAGGPGGGGGAPEVRRAVLPKPPAARQRVDAAAVAEAAAARRRYDRARVVSAAAPATHVDVVHAQQHQLHGDGRAFRAGADRQFLQDRAGELLHEEPQLDRIRPNRSSVRLCAPPVRRT